MNLVFKKIPEQFSFVSVLEYILMAFVLIYSSLWALFTSANSNTFLRLGIPLLAVLIFLRVRILKYPRMLRMFFIAAALLIYILFSRYNAVRFMLYYFLPVVLLTVYAGLVDEQGDIRELFFKLSDIVFVLSFISLFLFVFGTLFRIIPGQSTVSYDWAGSTRQAVTYFNLIYESQDINFLGHDLVRNCGIFAEAPGFAVFLVVSIATEVLLRSRIKFFRCAVLCATVLTTFSAKAIILALVAMGLRYLITNTGSLFTQRFKLFLTPAVLVLGAAAVFVVFADKAQSYSYLMRLDDLQASWRTFADSPVFGAGYVNDGAISDRFRLLTRPNNGLSMGVVLLLAQGGIWLTLLNAVPAVCMVARLCGELRKRWFCFLIVFWGLLFITNMPYSFLTMLVLACTFEGYRTGFNQSSALSEMQYA